MAITQSLRQQQLAQFLALVPHAHSQPCEHCHRQRSPWQLPREFGGKVTKINLARRERVEARDRTLSIEHDFRGRQPLVLMLQRLSTQPIIDLALPTIELPARVTSLQRGEGKPSRQGDRTHFVPRISAPSRF